MPWHFPRFVRRTVVQLYYHFIQQKSVVPGIVCTPSMECLPGLNFQVPHVTQHPLNLYQFNYMLFLFLKTYRTPPSQNFL